MNATEAKILKTFAANLTTQGDVMKAAHITCMTVRDEATALWGEDHGIAAFHATAELLINSMCDALASN